MYVMLCEMYHQKSLGVPQWIRIVSDVCEELDIPQESPPPALSPLHGLQINHPKILNTPRCLTFAVLILSGKKGPAVFMGISPETDIFQGFKNEIRSSCLRVEFESIKIVILPCSLHNQAQSFCLFLCNFCLKTPSESRLGTSKSL